MNSHVKLIIATPLLLLAFASKSFANASSSFSSSSYFSPTNSASQFFVNNPGLLLEKKAPTLDRDKMTAKEELLNHVGADLEWPAFPRVWAERNSARETSLAIDAGLLGASPFANLSADIYSMTTIKYRVQSQFIMMASDQIKSYSKDENGKTTIHSKMNESFIVQDPKTMRTYVDVKDDFPVVGVCVYGASLEMAISANGDVSFPGVRVRTSEGRIETATLTKFSKFFQVKREIPIEEYLNGFCQQQYEGLIKEQVDKDFSKVVLEKMFYNNPESECTPSPKESYDSTENGDLSCSKWHEKVVARPIRKRTVPRCVLQKDGAHRCELRSKENRSCTLYWSDEKKDWVETTQNSLRSSIDSSVFFAWQCDEKAGLRCQWDRKPKYALGLTIVPGSTSCRPK